MRYLFCLLFFVLCSWTIEKGNFSVHTTFSTDYLVPPQELEITIQMEYPTSYEISTDELKQQLLDHNPAFLPPFTLASKPIETEEELSGITTKTISFHLHANYTGDFPISFGPIRFNSKDQNVTLSSPISKVHVTLPAYEQYTLMELSTNIPLSISSENMYRLVNSPQAIHRQIERNIELFGQRQIPWQYVLIGLGLILGYYIFKLAQKKGPQQTLSPEERTKKVQKDALDQLRIVQQQVTPAASYSAIADVLRNFIENRYGLHTTVQTSQEFLEEIKEHPVFSQAARFQLSQFLLNADHVKFAKYEPSPEETNHAYTIAKGFIEL